MFCRFCSSMKTSAALFLCSLLSFATALPQAGNLTRRDVGFRADPAGNIGGIYLAALASTQVPLAAFPHNRDVFTDVQIYGDWLNLDGVSAFYFFADMDVDCDGVVSRSSAAPRKPF